MSSKGKLIVFGLILMLGIAGAVVLANTEIFSGKSVWEVRAIVYIILILGRLLPALLSRQ